MSKKKRTIEELLEESLIIEGEEPYSTPQNWKWVKLGSVITLISGRDISAKFCNNDAKGIPYIMGASNLVEGTLKVERWIEAPTVIGIKEDILISVKGTIGKTVIQEMESVHLSRQIMALRCKGEVFNKYLYWYIQIYIEKLKEAAKGIIPGISRDDILNAPFPLLPLNEQKRIVKKVEGLLNKIEDAKQLIEEVKETFEVRRAAILDKAFCGELTKKWREENLSKIMESSDAINGVDVNNNNAAATSSIPKNNIPDSWKWILSNNLFEFVTSGSRGWAKYYNDNGDFFIRVGNLNHNSIDIDLTNQQKVSPPQGAEGSRTLVQEGDILVSITADIGRIAIVPKQFPRAYINQHVALARTVSGYCIEYIAWFLSSRNGGKMQFDRLQRGATKAGLGLNDIKSVWVPIPSLDEQYEVIRKVKIAFKKFEVAEKNLTNTLEVCEELKKSILVKAFRGELGTNDPSEENAIELLKKILREQVK